MTSTLPSCHPCKPPSTVSSPKLFFPRHFHQNEEGFIGQRNHLSFCSCEEPYFQTFSELSSAEAERREQHTRAESLPAGLSITYETAVTHQVSLKRGKRKQLSPYLDGHSSQAGKELSALMLPCPVPQGHLCRWCQSPTP